MVQDGGIGNSLIWVPTDEPPHMRGVGSSRVWSGQSILQSRLSQGIN